MSGVIIRHLSEDDLLDIIEEALDNLDCLNPRWREELPDCEHVGCYSDEGSYHELQRLSDALWLLGEGSNLWRFRQ